MQDYSTNEKEYAAKVFPLQKQGDVTEECIDEIGRSHVIDLTTLRADNFDDFLSVRQIALLKRIEEAMSKSLPDTNQSAELEDTEAV